MSSDTLDTFVRAFFAWGPFAPSDGISGGVWLGAGGAGVGGLAGPLAVPMSGTAPEEVPTLPLVTPAGIGVVSCETLGVTELARPAGERQGDASGPEAPESVGGVGSALADCR